MTKTSNILVRLDPDLKAQAEAVLNQLGIPVSNAVNLFLKQVVLQRGIPFEIKLPSEKPVSMNELTALDLDRELQKGFDDLAKGKTRPAKKVFSDIHRDYDL